MRWLKVASVSDIPPDTARIYHLDRLLPPEGSMSTPMEVAIFKVNETFYCLNNTCPHLGGPLGEGWVEGNVVICPLHYWEFDIRTGESPDDPTLCVTTYPCKVEAGYVYIGLEEEAEEGP
ncbi:Rieske (2Fe-2S) protein [Chthonomonas calidirosea]|uniref:Rieske (2Fe-2S) protein n=1 Tax=Chthonomonas calidirosea TaxID=454171 RepID=UPI0006EC7222|nr:Rieske 2Fe-2S domain-containing protein [Chthonomonas calidirosea]CEK18127.1 ferredoxin subunit of nitrite reductase and ring-hydroxylating dioxygenase [Chthonomonas calidirosea]